MYQVKQIQNFLEANFKSSEHIGDLASNNKVIKTGDNIYKIKTGIPANDIEGTYEEIMKELQEALDLDNMLRENSNYES